MENKHEKPDPISDGRLAALKESWVNAQSSSAMDVLYELVSMFGSDTVIAATRELALESDHPVDIASRHSEDDQPGSKPCPICEGRGWVDWLE